MSALHSQNGVFASLGREILAPLLEHYARWLHEQARRDGVNHLLFLARDGYMMQRAYQAVIPPGEQIANTYMFASRRLCNLAAIRSLDGPALRFLLGDHPVMPVARYLERVGLNAHLYQREVVQAGFADGIETIVTKHEATALRDLMMALERPVLAVAEAERRRLKAYADSLADWDTATCGVVDIGWHGSLQASLRQVLGLEPGSLQGYYLGLHYGVSRSGPDRRKAFLDESKPTEFWLYINTFRRCVELFELLFAEPAGSIVGLREGPEGTFAALREPDHDDTAARASLGAAQAGCLQVLQAGGSGIRRNEMLRRVRRLMGRPTAVEAAAIGDIVHQEGFGGHGRLEFLARPHYSLRGYLGHPRELVWDVRKAFWRRGFLVRLFDRSFKDD